MDLVAQVSALLTKKNIMLVTAESCTGGLIAKMITDRPGSSAVLERGFVTYSNEAKSDLLGVSSSLLSEHGAVSREAALAMAVGALENSRAHIALSVTGIAGPGGGSPDKPIGLVYIGYALKGQNTLVKKFLFAGDRAAIRQQGADAALSLILEQAGA